MELATRNATLTDMANMLKDQHTRKLDVVAPATSIRSEFGSLVITGSEPILSPDGVTQTDGIYRPTVVCDEGIAEKLGIPTAYVRRLREERPDIYDANVNLWLHGNQFAAAETNPDPRSFLVRCFRSDESAEGVARAFLSDRYRVVDNLDVLMSVLQGIEDAGVPVVVDGCDLTERRMYVRIICPVVQVWAENLLRNYRNPFGDDFERWREIADREGLGFGEGTEPVVFAGFVVSNSEVGGGAFTITPRAVIKVCKNGLTITKDALRSVHLGGKLEEGVVDWSDETQQKAVELIHAKTVDAVRTFLSEEYLSGALAGLEARASEPVASIDEVKVLTKGLRFTPQQMDGILNRFVQGGQMSRAGVANAITAHAQTIGDADDAMALEAQAVAVLS